MFLKFAMIIKVARDARSVHRVKRKEENCIDLQTARGRLRRYEEKSAATNSSLHNVCALTLRCGLDVHVNSSELDKVREPILRMRHLASYASAHVISGSADLFLVPKLCTFSLIRSQM